MKALATLIVFCMLASTSKGSDPYRNYLLSKIYLQAQPKAQRDVAINPTVGASAFIPRFERPKGAIFCRMEDKVTKATKVWLKIGVQ